MMRSLTVPECQLYDAVQGLKYLHDTNLIHGDARGVCVWNTPNIPWIPYPLIGKYFREKRHAPYCVSRGFWVYHPGARPAGPDAPKPHVSQNRAFRCPGVARAF